MTVEYTHIRIKLDNFKVGDYEKIRTLAIKHDVPNRASVRIESTGLGTYLTFEWRDEVKPDFDKEKYKQYKPKSSKVFDAIVDPWMHN